MAGYAVERKTIEDLSASIKDGRYEEQRNRLSKAVGISSIVYIIEGSYEESYSNNPSLVSEQAIQTAIRHTELGTGFSVIQTRSIQETANAIIELHVRIESRGFDLDQDTDDMYATYRDFSTGSHKTGNMTVGQLTARMLRAIPGIGAETIGSLNEYLDKTQRPGGLIFANIVNVADDPNLNSSIKAVTGAKRIPFSTSALTVLREQYSSRSLSK
jgi:ERCC4-type nuclease